MEENERTTQLLTAEIEYLGPDRRHAPRTGWHATWLGRVVGRLWYLVAFSDTAQTRFFLAITATLWALALALPGDSFSRPTFLYMKAIADERDWLIGFAVYAAAAFWRLFSETQARVVALATNTLGLAMFVTVAFSVVTLPGTPFPAGAAAHCAIALAALWVLVRTHVNSPEGWRHD